MESAFHKIFWHSNDSHGMRKKSAITFFLLFRRLMKAIAFVCWSSRAYKSGCLCERTIQVDEIWNVVSRLLNFCAYFYKQHNLLKVRQKRNVQMKGGATIPRQNYVQHTKAQTLENVVMI